jgi:hypothetical protein
MAHADADMALDFYADWMATLRGALQNLAYSPPTDDQDAQIAYFNVFKRLVPVRRRAVHEAPSLVCPAEVQVGYDAVKRKVMAGEDLRPHLSRKLADRDFNDLLLNDWGIHHLHLGTVVEADGFARRTGPVLFARFLVDDAYFIGIPTHGPKASPWSDLKVLERFSETWPDQMSRYELRGIAPTRDGANPTSGELARLRAAGVQALITIGGKVYGPMGGGLSTAKVSVDVVRMMDRCVGIVREFERNVADAKEEIFSKAIERGIDLIRPVRLRMIVRQDGSAFATTHDWRFGFPLGQIT